ncbi:MAG: hypothetical protein Ta2A_20010 [Treponemataceae bacterium]|nr:MAG: hypothetical protein Ta2A_20010 [Treponemataceae bacterium]
MRPRVCYANSVAGCGGASVPRWRGVATQREVPGYWLRCAQLRSFSRMRVVAVAGWFCLLVLLAGSGCWFCWLLVLLAAGSAGWFWLAGSVVLVLPCWLSRAGSACWFCLLALVRWFWLACFATALRQVCSASLA